MALFILPAFTDLCTGGWMCSSRFWLDLNTLLSSFMTYSHRRWQRRLDQERSRSVTAVTLFVFIFSITRIKVVKRKPVRALNSSKSKNIRGTCVDLKFTLSNHHLTISCNLLRNMTAVLSILILLCSCYKRCKKKNLSRTGLIQSHKFPRSSMTGVCSRSPCLNLL